jgi:hypothetical protein
MEIHESKEPQLHSMNIVITQIAMFMDSAEVSNLSATCVLLKNLKQKCLKKLHYKCENVFQEYVGKDMERSNFVGEIWSHKDSNFTYREFSKLYGKLESLNEGYPCVLRQVKDSFKQVWYFHSAYKNFNFCTVSMFNECSCANTLDSVSHEDITMKDGTKENFDEFLETIFEEQFFPNSVRRILMVEIEKFVPTRCREWKTEKEYSSHCVEVFGTLHYWKEIKKKTFHDIKNKR